MFENQLFDKQLLLTPSPLFSHEDESLIEEHGQSEKMCDKLLQSCEPVERFLEFKNTSYFLETESCCLDSLSVSTDAFEEFEKGDRSDSTSWDQFSVPLSLIERWGSAMGIIFSLINVQYYFVMIMFFLFGKPPSLSKLILKISQILSILIQSVAAVLQKVIIDM